MNIFIAGDTHGEITALYERIFKLEERLGITADWVLQTGNLGVWPDPNRIDRATRNHGGDVDFFRYYLESRAVPRPTVFVAGKHEDHRWMNFRFSKGQLELLPNLHWLLNGYRTHISNEEDVSVVGLGKVFSPVSYISSITPKGKALSHYRKAEIDKACAHGPTDILLCHEAGHGTKLGGRMSVSEGINKLCWALRPKVMIHGHYNESKVYKNENTGTPTISLAFGEVRVLKYKDKKFSLLA